MDKSVLLASIAREKKAIERKTAEIEQHHAMVKFYQEALNAPDSKK